MNVTLFTDASFYHETHSAAYALYAISDRGTFTYAGRFHSSIKRSDQAELAAVANALHIILPNPIAAGATKIFLQVDCQNVIDWIKAGECRPYPEILARIQDVITKYQVLCEVRHIKAHSGVGEPRLYCHDWCDRECRRLAKREHVERSRQSPKRERAGGRKRVVKSRDRSV